MRVFTDRAPGEEILNNSDRRLLIYLITAAALVYLAALIYGIVVPQTRLLPDSYEYMTAAQNLAEDGVFYAGSLEGKLDYSLYTRRPPGYPVVLMLLFFIYPSPSLVAFFQIMLVFAGALLFWDLLREFGIFGRLRILALALYLLYPAQIIYSQLIMAETIFQFLILLSVWALTRFLKSSSTLFIFILNIGLGAAVLCKPVLLYFWIPSLVFHLFLYWKYRRAIILAACLVPLLASSCWSLRNYQVTGVFHFSSLAASHLKFYIPGENKRPLLETREDFAEDFQDTKESTLSLFSRPDYVVRKIRYTLKNLSAFFLDPGRFDLYTFLPLRDPGISSYVFLRSGGNRHSFLRKIPVPILLFLGLLLALNLLILLLFLPFPLLPRINPYLRFFVCLLILYNGAVVSAAAIGASRYRLAIEPLLLLGAVAVTAALGREIASRRGAGNNHKKDSPA